MGIAMIRVASSVNVKAPNPKHRVSGLDIIFLLLFPYLFLLKPCVWWWIDGKSFNSVLLASVYGSIISLFCY